MKTQTTTQGQPAKKLTLTKQSIRVLSGNQQKVVAAGPTAMCSGTC